MPWVLKTAPAAEPATLANVKTHLRVEQDMTEDDALINALVTAARQYIENVTGRALITQTWQYIVDEFPAAEFRLPWPPLQSIGSIKYKLKDASVSTLDSSVYAANTTEEPGLVCLAPDQSWPSDTLYSTGAVTVEYDCGYGAAEANVPQMLRQGLLLIVGHWYENRESVVVGSPASEIPMAADALIWPYRTWWWKPE